jgi:uncharacterized protein YbjQ (UPF0145 family)
MRHNGSPWSVLIAIAVCALAGCASVPDENIQRRASEIRIYSGTELPSSRVNVVGRIWVDSWRTAYADLTNPTEVDAIAALRVEAARLDAEALVNVVCLDQGRRQWWGKPEPATLCYGNAVRVRRREG